jgi:hypothetical protein
MTNIFLLQGYLYNYEPNYKRIYICFNNDDFTQQFIKNKVKNSIGTHPYIENYYDNRLPGFFIKYNGKTEFKKNNTLCTLDEIKENQVNIKVKYNIYNYKGKSGWNLLALEINKN